MKSKENISNFSLFQLIRNKSKLFSIITLFAFLNLSVSCSYYRSKSIKTNSDNFASKYKSIKKKERYIVLHSGDETHHLSNLVLNEDSKEITATVSDVDQGHNLYPLKENRTSRKYKKSKSKKTYEIHFYTKEPISKNSSSGITIPFADISKVDIYKTDTARVIFSAFGITLGTIVVLAIIIAAAKSSCPFIYIKEGDSFTFSGELYPGAILPTLERTDYLPLTNFIAQNGEYELKITNELLEIQHTDLAQLVVVNHSEDNEVLLDQNGNPHTLSKKENPKQVLIDDYLMKIEPSLKKDDISYLFDHQSHKGDDNNNVVLTFDNPKNSNQAKLVLTAKNSYWLDLVYGKFNKQFGSYFNQFQKEQHKVPVEKNIQWRNEQGIPLSVYVKSDNEWVLVEKINPVGPMAFRDLVIPIDLKNIKADKIEIKLECGFKFWEVDYAAIDFSNDSPVEAQYINPYSAIDENGKDVTDLLVKEDKNYLVQSEIGNEVVIKYRVKTAENGKKQSVFMKNRGYYEYIRNYRGIPNFAKLKTFKKKGALSRYSKEEYARFTEIRNLTETVFNHE